MAFFLFQLDLSLNFFISSKTKKTIIFFFVFINMVFFEIFAYFRLSIFLNALERFLPYFSLYVNKLNQQNGITQGARLSTIHSVETA